MEKKRKDQIYYQKHKEEMAARLKRNLEAKQRKVYTYLLSHPCVDCGESDPIVLTFDHIDPTQKIANVSLMITKGYGEANLWAEIAKCVVRCFNCHARRTAQQFNWWKNAYCE